MKFVQRMIFTAVMSTMVASAHAAEKPTMTIVEGSGYATMFTNNFIFSDPRVKLMLAKDYKVRHVPASDKIVHELGIHRLPAVVVKNLDGKVFRHEGSFSNIFDMVSFGISAKREINQERFVDGNQDDCGVGPAYDDKEVNRFTRMSTKEASELLTAYLFEVRPGDLYDPTGEGPDPIDFDSVK